MTYLVYLTGWVLLVPAILLQITGLILRSMVLRAWGASFTITATLGMGQWELRAHQWGPVAALAVLLAASGWLAASIYASTSPQARAEELLRAAGITSPSTPHR